MCRILFNLLLFAIIGLVGAASVRNLVTDSFTAIVGPHKSIKIVRGSIAQQGQFPYTVSFRMGNQHFCGGVIINKNHILTAAHCIRTAARNINNATIVTGSIYLDQGGESHKVAAMYYVVNFPGDGDIGMIKLADEINFNDYQQPIPLATNRPPEGAYAVVSGWGLTSTPPSQLSNMQQFLFVKIIDTNTCREVYGDITTEICTLNNVNQGICSGDSGGPLVFNGQVVGIVSRGVLCAQGYPDVFTSVYDNLQFINLEEAT
ncbi:chymotrypsin-1-like [Ptiloglossa arizonensis]|uniref:chymotrypsin-1-like n=1 Tax=Ptiloglossa arizonensis TaxID=3350558 RepID=UPI003F9EEBAD